MKKVQLILILGSLAVAGCGKDISGTYKGTETNVGYSGIAPVTIVLKQSDNAVSGTWSVDGSSSYGGSSSGAMSGTVMGTLNDNGDQIGNMTVTLMQSQSSGSQYGYSSQVMLTGSLSVSDAGLSGSLNLSNGGYSSSSSSGSTSTSTVTAAKQN